MTPISIIIPCYNGAATLARALQSCLIQPEAAQIIVVDDGSTDASAELVAQFGTPRRARGPAADAVQRRRGASAQLGRDACVARPARLPRCRRRISARRARPPRARSSRRTPGKCPCGSTSTTRIFRPNSPAHADFATHAATLSNTVPSSLIIRRAVYAALGGFPMDDAFRRIGGEDGAFSWALREIFGNRRLDDVKRVRMHYHAGIHAERYFRIALGMQTAGSRRRGRSIPFFEAVPRNRARGHRAIAHGKRRCRGQPHLRSRITLRNHHEPCAQPDSHRATPDNPITPRSHLDLLQSPFVFEERCDGYRESAYSPAARQARRLQSEGQDAHSAFLSTASNRAHVKFLVNFLERRA